MGPTTSEHSGLNEVVAGLGKMGPWKACLLHSLISIFSIVRANVVPASLEQHRPPPTTHPLGADSLLPLQSVEYSRKHIRRQQLQRNVVHWRALPTAGFFQRQLNRVDLASLARWGSIIIGRRLCCFFCGNRTLSTPFPRRDAGTHFEEQSTPEEQPADPTQGAGYRNKWRVWKVRSEEFLFV